MAEWTSPDNKIKKLVLTKGDGSCKPTENSECIIKLTNANIEIDIPETVCVGDGDGEFRRLLDETLQMMNANETSRINFYTENLTEFTLQLLSFTSPGLIYEWSATYKYELTMRHKNKGVSLFRENNISHASYRFCKALKILLSIPIDVGNVPSTIDGVDLMEINHLKAVLYSNLASCYLKIKRYDLVMGLCEKALCYDHESVKAIYKIGVSAFELHDYEKAHDCFRHVLDIEPGNAIALLNFRKAQGRLNEGNVKFNDIVRKMFQ